VLCCQFDIEFERSMIAYLLVILFKIQYMVLRGIRAVITKLAEISMNNIHYIGVFIIDTFFTRCVMFLAFRVKINQPPNERENPKKLIKKKKIIIINVDDFRL